MSFSKPAIRIETAVQTSADVWGYVNKLRVEYNAINHGQGYPNWQSPKYVKNAGIDAINNDFNQYAPNKGSFALKTELCKVYNKHYNKNRNESNIAFNLDNDNIQITNGCAGALDSCFRAFVDPGDEVLTIEPFFTFYRNQVEMCDATLKTISLDLEKNNSSWKLDLQKLENAINSKTRVLILNTPHNPTGYVISKPEMIEIVEIVLRYPKLLVVMDEVYEHITYGNDTHEYFACISKEIFERTLVCCSAAKTFSITGWKIGWVVGPKNLVKLVNITCRTNCWSVAAPLQEAIAGVLRQACLPFEGFDTYYEWLRDMYSRKRELMLDAIRSCGMNPIAPQGAYYIMVDAKKYLDQISFDKKFNVNDPTSFKDWQFVKWLIENIGVAVVPGSAFYDYKQFDAESIRKFPFIRFAFCVEDETIYETGKQLKLITKKLNDSQGIKAKL